MDLMRLQTLELVVAVQEEAEIVVWDLMAATVEMVAQAIYT